MLNVAIPQPFFNTVDWLIHVSSPTTVRVDAFLWSRFDYFFPSLRRRQWGLPVPRKAVSPLSPAVPGGNNHRVRQPRRDPHPDTIQPAAGGGRLVGFFASPNHPLKLIVFFLAIYLLLFFDLQARPTTRTPLCLDVRLVRRTFFPQTLTAVNPRFSFNEDFE